MAEKGNWAGVVLILVGVAFLLVNLDIIDIGHLFEYWPLILIAAGLRLVLRDRGARSRTVPGPPPPPS